MKKTKLLLIDDEKPLLQNLKQILEFEDFEVVTAGNGVEGLLQYEKESPDMVICDIMMPEMDGYGFIKNLRSRGHTQAPFIFLTAKSEYDDLREGMNYGADDYLVKPIKSSQLIEAINIRLQRKREVNKKVEAQLTQIENGFRLLTDQAFFESVYDIIGYLHLLKSKHNQLDEESLQEYYGYMERSGNRLLGLLRKIKNWHEQDKALTENKKDPSTVSIAGNILEKLALQFAEQYKRSADLIFEDIEEVLIPLHEGFLETILSELLDNAFKFSQKGDTVVLSVIAKEGNAVIRIADQSKSSNATFLNNIRLLNKNNEAAQVDPGLGIGLAIVSMLLKNAEGTLNFSNNSPAGIIVSISIPLIKAAD